MNITPLRFSANALIDMGGSGIRLDVSRNNGDMFPVENDAFRGAVNLRFTEVQGQLTLDNVLTQLVDKFIAKRLQDGSADAKRLQAILTEEPIERTVVSTAGQIKEKDGYQYLTAAANMPDAMQNVDFLGAFRRIFKERMDANNLTPLLKKRSFNHKGRIMNDALAGVMALARQIETRHESPLNAASKPVIMLDVGSGIATGGISGNMLYTAESQNTRGLVPNAVIARALTLLKSDKDASVQQGLKILANAQTQSLEDRGSMRGMSWQTLQYLERMTPAARGKNPYYQAIRNVALQRDSEKAPANQQFKGSAKAFDKYFSGDFGAGLLAQAWKERWVSESSILYSALTNPEDILAQTVFGDMVDALAALGANKVMETGSNKVYVQFIDMDNAVARVNKERAADSKDPIENPLAKRVQQRMWEHYLHKSIASTFFDAEKGVELADLRNTEGTAYFAQAFGTTRKSPWQIKGVQTSVLQKQV